MLKSAVKILCMALFCFVSMNVAADDGAVADDTAQSYTFKGLTVDDYKKGKTQLLVYSHDPSTKAVSNVSLWERSLDIVELDGEKVVQLSQSWHSSSERFRREIVSLNRVADFTPIKHRAVEGAKKHLLAYAFSDDGIVADASVVGNQRGEFFMAKSPATYNWELDLETLALLPLEQGKSFALNFYHPGARTGPKNYTYTVVGDEILRTSDGVSIDAWKVRINYTDENFAVFWFSKVGHNFLKMEELWDGMARTKVRLDIITNP